MSLSYLLDRKLSNGYIVEEIKIIKYNVVNYHDIIYTVEYSQEYNQLFSQASIFIHITSIPWVCISSQAPHISNVQRFSRAPRELTGGFNYYWLTGKKITHGYTDDLTCANSQAMTPTARAAFSRTRAREIETVSREIPIGIHAYGGRMCEPILFFFFSTHASLAEKMIFMSESCVFAFARKRQAACRLVLRLYVSHMFNACICQILKFNYFSNVWCQNRMYKGLDNPGLVLIYLWYILYIIIMLKNIITKYNYKKNIITKKIRIWQIPFIKSIII